MKFPLSLLKRFLITDASLETISATLTAIGLEVDGIEDKSAELKQFVVAEITHAEKHPQADKLQVCKVNSAQGELQIVCGAPNARAGIKVALANIGSIIPTNGMEIKKAAVRGVESQGMMCSARELGLGDDHAGIIELPLTATIGDSIVDVMGLGDPVLDINVTANRGDCMGVYGIARDLAAAGLGKLKPLCMPEIKTSGPCPIAINIIDSDGCPVFVGRAIRGVKNGASPEWLQRTLTAAGMRPISALVDITNYFSLAFGRPLHVYDMAKLSGNIIVRNAREGEQLLALNDKTYTLTATDCVIADDTAALGIGGVMGGASTGVSDTTTDVLLEVALFNPARIAKTGQHHTIISDARTRFERGVDVGFVEQADLRATDLILELCGGVASERVLAGELTFKTPEIAFDAASINALGGVDVAESRQREILTALGFRDHGAHMHAPSWRHDCSQPADLAEEVLRIIGYDNIPLASLPKPTTISRPAIDSKQARSSNVRRALAARGMHEAYSWGFCSEAQAAAFGGQAEALHLINPISAELSVMRPNILPHLLDALNANAARGLRDVALFEVGATFCLIPPPARGRLGGGQPDGKATPTLTLPLAGGGDIEQRTVAVGVRTGLKHGTHWAHSAPADVFDVKADVLAALEAAGFDASKAQISRNVPAWYHPGRSGAFTLGPKTVLATFGELHPATLKTLGIDFPVLAFEIHLDALPASKAAKRKALATSDFQSVTRDFAFVVDGQMAAADLVRAIQGAEKTLLRDVTIFDVYAGKGVEDGKKSIALTVTLQADDCTLTEAEIETVTKAIIAGAMKLGAVLR